MRICIVGCGAIGGLYAAHLAQLPELEVWAYEVSSAHVEAINRDGLRVGGVAELVGRVHATADPTEIPACELGIVAVKGMLTEEAISASAASFADGAVCSVQNGIGNEEVIAEHVPRVMRGVTLPAARVAGPGLIHMDGAGTTWIGPFEPKPAQLVEVQRLGSLLNASGMETRVLADARGAQWTKLLFNCATNPLCALTGLTHGELCELPATRRVVGELLSEGRAVAGAPWGSLLRRTRRSSLTRSAERTTTTSRACSRMCWPIDRPRSGRSTRPWWRRRARVGCRRR